jgi:uncharacterized membrane protein (DUF4010 family)
LEQGPREIALGLAVSAAIGLLIGLERERRSQVDDVHVMAGVRTFPLIAITAALGALLYPAFGAVVIALPLAGLVTLMGVAIWWRHRTSGLDRTVGMTTGMAALVTYLVGLLPFASGLGLAFRPRLVLATGLGGLTMAALALRQPLHRWARRVSAEDLYATARFVLLAAVVLPLLPDEPLGPYGALNPFAVGVVVVLIAAISFFGYIAVRALGPRRGAGVTALFGGLASSTAVTLSFASRGRRAPAMAPTAVLAILVASTVMFPRLALEVAIIGPGLLAHVAVPLAAMAVTGVVASFLSWRQAGREEDHGARPAFANPFRLGEAVRLGLMYAVIRLATTSLGARFGAGGLYVSAAVAGLADVNAIALSVAGLFREGRAGAFEAAGSVLIAAGVNTLSKAVLAGVLGRRRVGVPVATALGAVLVAGAAAWLGWSWP